MMFPFDSLVAEHKELGLIVAVLLGFGFGFVLERAGFGRSTKLAAQFYFTDMTVFKVMFSAIVTAMLGLVLVSGLGLADLPTLSQKIVSWTYIWPMLIGGLVLGVGFIVSGYCPGTSVVGAASGHKDLIVVTENGQKEIPSATLGYQGRVFALENGFEAWNQFALTVPEPPGPATSEEDRRDYLFQAALYQTLTGDGQAAAPPPAPTAVYVPKKKKGGGGCN